ncbi:STAS domain-containing protein [Streptomyces sp. NPDC087917]|uniref:STAS domain-containing protein n=1 Tax=Streptomyces sp. NPDC087917 TaxID=3155060 RepID=UPI003429160E
MSNQCEGGPVPSASLRANLRPSVVALAFEPGPHRVLARVRGEIDLADAVVFREQLTAALHASRRGIDVDLSAVTFCDSSGLHVLLDLNREAVEAGKSLVLFSLSRPVARLLEITDTRHLFTVSGPSVTTAARVDGHPGPPSATDFAGDIG